MAEHNAKYMFEEQYKIRLDTDAERYAEAERILTEEMNRNDY